MDQAICLVHRCNAVAYGKAIFVLRGPLRTLNYAVNENREAGINQLSCDFSRLSSGSNETRIRDLHHSWKANAMRSGLHHLIADAIVGHGDRKKDVKSIYLTIGDADLVKEIDKLTFDHGKTDIWGTKMTEYIMTLVGDNNSITLRRCFAF